MYEEVIRGANETIASTYTRLESEDWANLEGKRIKGHGKIVTWTNAKGEHHPAFVTTEDGSMFTPEELEHVEFDGRHRFVNYEVQTKTTA